MDATGNHETAAGRSSNPFVCNICNRTYGRIDHLARHFRSHSHEKPFECRDCGKRFARADLLKRHSAIHTGAPTGRKRRPRVLHACEACIKAKLKCEEPQEGQPCRRCQKKGIDCRRDSGTPSMPPIDLSPGLNESGLTHEHGRLGGSLSQSSLMPVGETSRVVDDPTLSAFLRDILQDGSEPSLPGMNIHQAYASNVTGNHTPLNVLDFSQDLSLGFQDIDLEAFGGWDDWLSPGFIAGVSEYDGRTECSASSLHDSIGLGSAAFKRSPWRWFPNHEKGGQVEDGLAEAVEERVHQRPRSQHQPNRRLTERMRDRMLSTLLNVCDADNSERLLRSFPSTAVLDVLIHDYLKDHESRLDHWIHAPTIRFGEVPPELLTLMAAAGATLSPIGEVQKFGYGLQEMCRLAILHMFEKDNSNTRSLHHLQTFALCLDIGAWSGDKRIMELAEAHTMVLVTMLRRSDRFRSPAMPPLSPYPADTPDVLESKWRTWVEAESNKRLALHVYTSTAQGSIAFQVPPIISYSEITLELPSHKDLWIARSAAAWRDRFLTQPFSAPLPALTECLWSIEVVERVRDRIDVGLVIYVILLHHWSLVWEYRQLETTIKAQSSTTSFWSPELLASYQQRELRTLLDGFQVAIDSWCLPVPRQVRILAALVRLNLCAAFDDLQILAGKEGTEKARKTYPALKAWHQSADARQAMCHAGQILSAATREHLVTTGKEEQMTIRDFDAVVVYHAGLAFWVYGLLSKVSLDDDWMNDGSHVPALPLSGGKNPATSTGRTLCCLNLLRGNAEELAHRFVALNKGTPTLMPPSQLREGPESLLVGQQEVPLHHVGMIMQLVAETMRRGTNYVPLAPRAHPAQLPAMVQNLIQLLNDLGAAATAL